MWLLWFCKPECLIGCWCYALAAWSLPTALIFQNKRIVLVTLFTGQVFLLHEKSSNFNHFLFTEAVLNDWMLYKSALLTRVIMIYPFLLNICIVLLWHSPKCFYWCNSVDFARFGREVYLWYFILPCSFYAADLYSLYYSTDIHSLRLRTISFWGVAP